MRSGVLPCASSKESFLEESQLSAHATQAPPLPHWETTPEDLKAATREIKAAIRARIEASGRTVEEVFAVVEAQLTERVAEIEDAKRRGETIWPVIDYADIEAGTVSAGGGRAPAPPRLRRHPRPLRARPGARLGPGHRRLRRAQRLLRRTTAAPATTSSAASARAPRSTPCTGRRRRWRRARATAWRGSSRSSTTGGPTSPTACSGSTPTATRSTPTASAVARRARTPAAWAPTSTPARSTCG